MTKVKICGISDPAALDAAIEGRADWVGFVFFPPSPRYVAPATARRLVARAAGCTLRVGLFVDPTLDEIARVLDQAPLDILQIYGAQADLPAIKARFNLPVWRAVGVGSASDLPSASDAEDGFVVEAQASADASRPGGNGRVFDWTLVKGWKAPRPWLLAGGLTPRNVAQAIRVAEAPAVDVSSGVEQAKGVKSPALIRAFIEAARA